MVAMSRKPRARKLRKREATKRAERTAARRTTPRPREKDRHRHARIRLVEPEIERYGTVRKEHPRYEVQIGERRVTVPVPVQTDPIPRGWRAPENPMRAGLALKVGRHDKVLGVVFLVRTKKRSQGSGRAARRRRGGEHGALERGLLEWDGETVDSMVAAAAGLALEYAGVHKPGRQELEDLAGELQKLPMWSDLIQRIRLAPKLEAVREVMLE